MGVFNIEPSSCISLLIPSSFPPLEKSLTSEPLFPILKFQYLKNLGMIKERYKRLVPNSFDLQTFQLYVGSMKKLQTLFEPEIVNEFYPNIHQNDASKDKAKIYCFLCSLAFFETLSQKFHETYVFFK